MARWFDVYGRLRAVPTIATAAMVGGVGYLDSRFLSCVQAAESYHRITGRDAVDEPTIHDARVSRILAAAPDADHEWLRHRLEWSNQPSLALRLEDLLGAIQHEVGFRGDPRRIARRVAATRNALTHRTKDKRAAGWHGQVVLMETVWLSLLASVLKDTGFTARFIRERLARDSRCRYLRTHDVLDVD